MQTLNYVGHNCHDVQHGDRRMLFHIPTTALYDLDEVGGAVLDLFKDKGQVSQQDIERHFRGRFAANEVLETLQDFQDLHILSPRADMRPENPRVEIREYPLSTVVLNVNTGCNLGCSYCYKEDLVAASDGEKMDFETAKKSIELLLKEGDKRERLNVVFFGGEPLTNLPLIKRVVDYAEARCAEVGKVVDFSMTTNATMLTEEIVDYLDAHRFSIAVSMDGPKKVHDRHRLTVGGKGTYDVVTRKVKMLLSRYTSRPIGARVTLSAGNTQVVETQRHLKDELGFFEVGYAPVTSSDNAFYNLSGPELAEVFEQMKALGREYEAAALKGENTGFSNMHQLMTDLYEGTRKSLPCGAGLGMLAVDKEGGLNLCHRFTGSDVPTYGNVDDGIDKPALGQFLADASDRADKGCGSCRIRNLCAGGCYHESYAHYHDPLHPTYHYCDLMRDWVDFGLSVYGNIIENNPAFFERHVTPRRAQYETTQISQ